MNSTPYICAAQVVKHEETTNIQAAFGLGVFLKSLVSFTGDLISNFNMKVTPVPKAMKGTYVNHVAISAEAKSRQSILDYAEELIRANKQEGVRVDVKTKGTWAFVDVYFEAQVDFKDLRPIKSRFKVNFDIKNNKLVQKIVDKVRKNQKQVAKRDNKQLPIVARSQAPEVVAAGKILNDFISAFDVLDSYDWRFKQDTRYISKDSGDYKGLCPGFLFETHASMIKSEVEIDICEALAANLHRVAKCIGCQLFMDVQGSKVKFRVFVSENPRLCNIQVQSSQLQKYL